MQAIQDGLQRTARAAEQAVGIVILNRLNSWVQAGLQASAMGQVLNFQFEQLSRTLAGLFGPEIQKLIDLVGQFVQWINNLSDQQKELIARLVEGAAAALLVAKVVPFLFSGIMMLVGGVQALVAAFVELDVASGGILPVVGAVLTALAALAVGTEIGRSGMAELWKVIKPVVDAFGALAQTIAAQLAPIISTLADAFLEVVGVVAELLPDVIELIQAGFEVLIPVLQIIVSILHLLMPLIKIVVELFVAWEKVIIHQLIGPLKALAFILNQIVSLMERLGLLPPPRALQPSTGNRGQAAPRFGGVDSDASAAYFRVAQASILATQGRRSHEDEVETQLRTIAANTDRTNDSVRRIPQPVGA